MRKRMKEDISLIQNEINDKKLKNYIWGTISIWFFVFCLNFYEYNNGSSNNICTYIAIFIMITTNVLGLITKFEVRKNKPIFLLFKTYSTLFLSIGFIAFSNTIYYKWIKGDNILFCILTILFSILIFISRFISIYNKLKNNIKISNTSEFNKKHFEAITLILFIIGCFCIAPIIKNTLSQYSIYVLLIAISLPVAFLLFSTTAYYLLTYLFAKNKASFIGITKNKF